MSEEYIWNVMESDAEDENLYEIITEHFEAITEFFHELDYVAFLHRPDVIFALLVALLCSVYLIVWCTGDSSWQLAVRNRLTGLLLLSQGCKGGGENDSWEQKTERVVVYAIRGRRDKMEDRFVSQTVKDTKVQINAVFDGHGGEFSVEYVRKHLVDSLEMRIRLLKILISTKLSSEEKIKMYEATADRDITPQVLAYLNVSEADYRQISPAGKAFQEQPTTPTTPTTLNPPPPTDLRRSPSRTAEEPASIGSSMIKSSGGRSLSPGPLGRRSPGPSTKSPPSASAPKYPPVVSSRRKSIDEFPMPNAPSPPKAEVESSLSPYSKSSSIKKKPSFSQGKLIGSSEVEVSDITDFLSNGEILYGKLMKDEIAHVDKKLLVASKEKGQFSGTTLLLTILDGGTLWVANVGDSRGVMCNSKGVAVPISFDHKPCQLKEKRRIEEAGGFVAMNGVWRVQGILATSRALGDFPLKDKNVLTAEPDILSFDLDRYEAEFVLLASDGLWDTHSNEEAVAHIRKYAGSGIAGAKSLAFDCFNKGSLDNITIMVVKCT